MAENDAAASPDLVRLLALLVLCLYPVAVISQGIDFTDMGFNMANQRLLLTHPESYVHGHLFYLSNLLGGLWLLLTEPLGLFGARLGWVVVVAVTTLSAYRALRGLVPDRALLVGLCATLVWSNRFGVVWIDYNHVAAMFGTVAGMTLCRWPGRPGSLLAGILVACAAAARLPSIAFILLGVVPLLPSEATRHWRQRIGSALTFLAGVLLGVALLAAFMSALGHLELYRAALELRLSTGQSNPDYYYSAGTLIGGVVGDYLRVALTAAVALALVAAYFRLSIGARAPRERVLLIAALAGAAFLLARFDGLVVIAAALAAAMAAALDTVDRDRRMPDEQPRRWQSAASAAVSAALIAAVLPSHWPWLLPATMILSLVWLATQSDSVALRRAAVVAVVLIVATPLGSGNGIRNAVFGLWLGLPLLLWFGWAGWPRREPGAVGAGRNLTIAFFVALIVSGLANAWASPYRDVPDRFALVHAPAASFVSSGFTNEARAAVVEELGRGLAPYLNAGDELLVHGSCPLVHVITQTRPALGVTWPYVYTLDVFERRLEELATRASKLPPVLMSAGSCRAAEWPARVSMTASERGQRRHLEAFLSANGYEQRWSNRFFSFWTVRRPQA